MDSKHQSENNICTVMMVSYASEAEGLTSEQPRAKADRPDAVVWTGSTVKGERAVHQTMRARIPASNGRRQAQFRSFRSIIVSFLLLTESTSEQPARSDESTDPLLADQCTLSSKCRLPCGAETVSY